ncbi:GNAT family N-acetyltransferase [Saccharopolyspora rosea]|uniref:GNAT family N-acetyltransferase n=1 Tax=Saccharopolyspora rosea TaxID=524884 RepID=A0ABW3FKJ8_9PSEU|nr:GNAT family N-acetyltransferase [Saccharopolyspora rosea]
MHELRSPAEVAEATGDLVVRWAAQALTQDYPHERGAAWRLGEAVAVHAPELNRNDRLVFTGPADDAAELLSRTMPSLAGERLRPLAATALAHQVATRLDLRVRATFGWMHLVAEPPTAPAPDVEWLAPSDEEAVTCLLRKANPRSYVFPDDPGARRWAGVRDADGELLAVGADTWPAPGVRFIAGVATHPDHRGRGLSTSVCAFLTRELAREGAVTLMVDADNTAALKVYRRLGFRYRSVTALAR